MALVHKKLSTRTKFLYGLGDWGASAATTARNVFWFVFLTNVVGLDAGLAGTATLVGRLWDGINDPLVGMLSDRLQTRWGRRRPFLLFGSIPFAIAFILLFWVPPFENRFALTAYYSFAYLLFDTLYTIVNVPYTALTPELTEDYDERSSLTGWRVSVSIFASLVTGAFFKLLAENLFAPWFGVGTEAIRYGYLLAAFLWSLTLAVPLILLFRHIEEPESHHADETPFNPVRMFRDVFANRPFRLGALIYLITFTTGDIILVVFVRFLVDYLRVPTGFDNLILAIVLGVAFVSMPLVVRLMHRYGKRLTYIGSMSFMAVVLIIMSLVPPGHLNWIYVAGVLAGLGFGAVNVIPWAIVADVVEEDELRTGQRREGIYAGYLVFFRKLASAVTIFMVGQVLSWTGFISSTSGSTFIQQPDSALWALRFLVGVLPAVMLVLGIMVAWRYPLDKEAHEAIRLALEKKRQAIKNASTEEGVFK